ncbi:hypothetical protein [Nitrosomonas eutropha]|uniref:Uncharacterized protein n=2 Tax=Nitrosomonas eutropha TaxID=916 RepID=A0ABX5MDP0_9PROT|nr:hypothetical protein [Nitrosomonas eutropha]ABI59740.1 hypothetical protein Neut_1495 [Nitrosomonas eutropha C91]PXV82459.1 hypothetical protein C8R14_10731 [Nitrosomonas eutropha]
MNPSHEFIAAVRQHRELLETLGEDHADTIRAMMLAMELAPEELKDEMMDKAQEMGLIPEISGYLEDGTPMVRLEDIAKRLGLSPEQAEEAMHKMLADREALGLSNDGLVVTDAAMIHRKQ